MGLTNFFTSFSIPESMKSGGTFKTWMIIIAISSLIALMYYLYNMYSQKYLVPLEENLGDPDLENNSVDLMYFYVNWCPHCKTSMPIWNDLKSEYSNKKLNGYTVNFIEYNCTDETSEITAIINKYNIEGYPTIKLVKGGNVFDYDTDISKDKLEQFLVQIL